MRRTAHPADYLEGLFGGDAWPALDTLKAEIEKRQRRASELMDTLIVYHQRDMFGGSPRIPPNSTASRKR
jgi:hypothetical protein